MSETNTIKKDKDYFYKKNIDWLEKKQANRKNLELAQEDEKQRRYEEERKSHKKKLSQQNNINTTGKREDTNSGTKNNSKSPKK